MSDTFKRCKKCGKMIGIITERAYRNILVDAEAVTVVADPLGDIFIRHDGTKLRAREVNDMETFAKVVHGRPGHETAYRPHHCDEV